MLHLRTPHGWTRYAGFSAESSAETPGVLQKSPWISNRICVCTCTLTQQHGNGVLADVVVQVRGAARPVQRTAQAEHGVRGAQQESRHVPHLSVRTVLGRRRFAVADFVILSYCRTNTRARTLRLFLQFYSPFVYFTHAQIFMSSAFFVQQTDHNFQPLERFKLEYNNSWTTIIIREIL